jgi:hypothetical protein
MCSLIFTNCIHACIRTYIHLWLHIQVGRMIYIYSSYTRFFPCIQACTLKSQVTPLLPCNSVMRNMHIFPCASMYTQMQSRKQLYTALLLSCAMDQSTGHEYQRVAAALLCTCLHAALLCMCLQTALLCMCLQAALLCMCPHAALLCMCLHEYACKWCDAAAASHRGGSSPVCMHTHTL